MVYPKIYTRKQIPIERNVVNINNYERNVITNYEEFKQEIMKVTGVKSKYKSWWYHEFRDWCYIDQGDNQGFKAGDLIVIHHSKKMKRDFQGYNCIRKVIKNWCKGGLQSDLLEIKDEDCLELIEK